MGVNGIYGLSGSGLDIESMVKVGMMSKENQYAKMQQTYTKNEWTKAAYLEIYDKIQDYNLNTLSDYKLSSSTNARTATSSNSVIKATASAAAPAMTHEITVESTATSAYLVGTKSLERGSTAETPNSTKMIDSLFSKWEEVKDDPDDPTKVTEYKFYGWVEDIEDGKGLGTYSAKTDTPVYTIDLTKNTSDIALSATAMSFNLSDGNGKTTVTANPEKTISVSYKDIIDGFSYYDLASKINNTGTNVKANYDAMQDKFSIYNMKTGTSNNITLTMNANEGATDNGKKLAETFFDRLGLKNYAASDDLSKVPTINFTTSNPETVTGGNAAVWVDHQKYENIDSNNLTVQGVTYNFANVTEKTTATVTVEQDVDTIVKNVKSFIDSYNELLNDLYTKYRETPNSSYKPLTEAQKNEMTEEQIKKWEEKAKSGLLYHDSNIRRIIDQMRSAISDSISGLDDDYKYDNAYSIGISTKGLYGQLTLDEDKLRAALNDDPDSVYKVFSTLDSTKEDAADSANGIAQRLGGIMTKAVKSISNVAGTSSDISDDSRLSTLLRNLQTRMSNFQTMMNAFENQLYKKYDAMESALAMLGSQLNYVTSAFSG